MVHNGIEYAHDAGLRRGLGAARGRRLVDRRARGVPVLAARARSSAPGCWTCWSRALDEDATWPSSRGYADDSGEGRWTVRGRDRPRRAAAGHHRRRCSPGSPPARTTRRDEDGRRAAQPVRRPRRRQRRRRGDASPGDAAGVLRRDARRAPVARRLPLLRPGRGRRSTRASRPSSGRTARARPTWSRPSATSPRSAATGSPRTRRWSGMGRRARSSGPAWSGTTGSELVELEINPGRANRARINRARRSAPARGARDAAHGAVRARGPRRW